MNFAILTIETIRPREGNRAVGGFDDESLQDLAASISENGVLQAITVREIEDEQGQYEIVAGERRWRASQIAAQTTIPATIMDRDVSDESIELAAIIENVQRDDIHPMDESSAYDRLREMGMKQTEIAKAVGRSEGHISTRLRLQSLTDEAQEYFANGELTIGAAEKLARAPESHQADVIKQAKKGYYGLAEQGIASAVDSSTYDLSTATFDTEDAELLAGVEKLPKKVDYLGACGGCPYLMVAEAQRVLFDDEGNRNDSTVDEPRCSNKACWKAKTLAHVDQVRQKLIADGVKFVEATENQSPKDKTLWAGWTWSIVQDDGDAELEKKQRGVKRVLRIDGRDAGKVVWGKKRQDHNSGGYSEADYQKALAERKVRIDRRIVGWSMLCDRLGTAELLDRSDVATALLGELVETYAAAEVLVEKFGIELKDEDDGRAYVSRDAVSVAVMQSVKGKPVGEIRRMILYALLAQAVQVDVEDKYEGIDEDTDLLNSLIREHDIVLPENPTWPPEAPKVEVPAPLVPAQEIPEPPAPPQEETE